MCNYVLLLSYNMSNNLSEFTHKLRQHLLHVPTQDQEAFFENITSFIFSEEYQPTFILKGYAGTGKTTCISTIVNTLKEIDINCVLAAPTGRAAKVMSNYTHRHSSTIHRLIYKLKKGGDGFSNFQLQPNKNQNTLFIVDEASMIGDHSSDFGRSLLDDLFTYVYSGLNCRLLLVGDSAQLPPVGCSDSPALDEEYLKSSFSTTVFTSTLKQVVRQQADSGVLYNATNLRVQLLEGTEELYPKLDVGTYHDILKLEGADVVDTLTSAYDNDGVDETIVVCRSNKRANIYNQQIRARIRWQESEISAGDYIMCVKNNYFWLPEEAEAKFIANGDILYINSLRSHKELYGLRFCTASVNLIDYPNMPAIDIIVMLDTLTSESPALTQEQNKRFYEEVLQDYADEPSRTKRNELVKKNEYFNALQIKFAYALTCHKAQGGQWEHVFIDHGYLTDEMMNQDFFRWLYTAITRTKSKVYLVNFNKEFFSDL